jgi:hypothetical protein
MAFRSSLDLGDYSGPKRNIPVGGVSLGAGDRASKKGQSLSSFENFSPELNPYFGRNRKRAKEFSV